MERRAPSCPNSICGHDRAWPSSIVIERHHHTDRLSTMSSTVRTHLYLICACLFSLSACSTLGGARKTAQTKMVRAQQTIPEEKLLDVDIVIFTGDAISEKRARKEGTNPEVRKAENHFIPHHLKNTLEQSGHWGMVRVTPVPSDAAEVLVRGEIIESNGEHLEVKLSVSDASGRVWLEKRYHASATGGDYLGTTAGEKDAFQGLYNAVSNDMARLLQGLSPDQIQTLRTVSNLRFAGNFAPQVFGDYLQENKGSFTVKRLPADNDTMMARILQIRERQYMLEDVINQYYEDFYNKMWVPYEGWRSANLTERLALAQQKRSALLREAAGAMLIALAILGEVSDVHDSGALTATMVILGGQVFLSGVNISKQAQMHYETLAELSESFGSEMKSAVMEFEGKKYELTGSAEEQYKRWRELLRQIYYAETGFSAAETSDKAEPK